MEKKLSDFIQSNSPDGGFLQSVHWQKFQESYGRKTFQLEEKDESGELAAYANIITHSLPIAGDYFYIPRGPVFKNQKPKTKNQRFFDELFGLVKENNIGWIRIEPNSEEELDFIKKNLPRGLIIKKSSVDIQPREILVLDISGSEDDILTQMKQKTRYNIRLAEKRGVHISHNIEHMTHNINEFLRLVKLTAKRDRITSHPDGYYRKMFETIPPEILKLYVAKYEGKIISANLVLFFGRTATYLHGASANVHRDVMAPYLLQWQQILNAKKAGCTKYDFGGVKVHDVSGKSWAGVTKFKTGFAPETKPIHFPGCYDIVLKPAKYNLYRILQKVKKIF